jgi:hypothetical protein
MAGLCQSCALRSIARDANTYSNGITCPLCHCRNRKAFGGICDKRKTPNSLVDVPCSCDVCYLSACEQTLFTSAKDYFTDKLSPHARLTESKRLLKLSDMIRTYWCLGYTGEFHEGDLAGRTAGAGGAKLTLSEDQLRLEVARLEELRLNRRGSVQTYDVFAQSQALLEHELPLGFLGGAAAHRNAAAERAYHHNNSRGDAPAAPPTESRMQKRNRIIQAVEATRNHQSVQQKALNVLEKIVLVTLFTHCIPSDPAFRFRFSTPDQIVLAIRTVVQRLSRCGGNIKASFVNRTCGPLTAAVVQQIMTGLVSSGYLTTAWDLTEVIFDVVLYP